MPANPQLYGFAYQNTYSDGFYYGDQLSDELPACDSRDIECQEISTQREAVKEVILLILAFIVISIATLVIYYMKRRKKFRQSGKAISELLDIDKLDPSHGHQEFSDE